MSKLMFLFLMRTNQSQVSYSEGAGADTSHRFKYKGWGIDRGSIEWRYLFLLAIILWDSMTMNNE